MSTEVSTGSESSVDVSESMRAIRKQIETLAHDARHLYAGAVRVVKAVESPEAGLWSRPFKLHERARPWAKRHMVASTSSLWQVHETLVGLAKKENRILTGGRVQLRKDEADILGLTADEAVPIWKVLGRLPRFFV